MNSVSINSSAFRVSSLEVYDYIKSLCGKLEKDLKLSEKDNIIYLSAPITGIKDYKQTFNLMKEFAKYIYHNKDVFIIDPTEYIDTIITGEPNLHPTYIDMIIFSLELLKYADTMFIYDKDKEAWINSRGCLIEAAYANYNNIDMYNYEYIIEAAIDIDEKGEKFYSFIKENDKETYYKLIASRVKVEGENNEEA